MERRGSLLGGIFSRTQRGASVVSLPAQLDRWPASYRDLYEERAGIMQFDGLMSRDQAELLAESEIRRQADEEVGGKRVSA